MKILIASGSRTGSHAFCQIQPVEHNFFEIMNIEDLLLPRLEDSSIDFSVCSKEFISAIEDHDWEQAWLLKPDLLTTHHLLAYDNNLNKIAITEYPTLSEIINAQRNRWEIIKKLDSWCIKLIMYQTVTDDIFDEMVAHADKCYILKRRDKIAQALSMTKATQTQQWHGTIDNPIIADAGDIDYRIFSVRCRNIRDEDKWLDFKFKDYNPEYIYYEDLDLSDSNFVKNHVSLKYDKTLCERYWELSNTEINNWFKEFITNYNWEPLYALKPTDGYFKTVTDPTVNNLSYWDLHLIALNAIDIDNMSRDIAWLDIGIWFGIMPFVMKQNGFANIETTDCAVHRIGNDEYFGQLWSTFDLQPKELEIRPKVRFDLGKKYDLITIMKSNVFWKTEEVIHYNGRKLSVAWQNQGIDGDTHTYFSVYNKEEWEFFVENIKEFLNPGGVAVVNPEPWAYDTIPSTFPARDYLKQFQLDDDMFKPNHPYSKYLIIRK